MELREKSVPVMEQVNECIKEIDSLKRSIQGKKQFIEQEYNKPKTEAFLFTTEVEAKKDIIRFESELEIIKKVYMQRLKVLAGLPI